MSRIEEELACDGWHGFGGGYVIGKANSDLTGAIEGKDVYCHTCPLNKSCWFKHRARVQLTSPKAALAFDNLCNELGDHGVAMFEFKKKTGWLDPYTHWMKLNFEDGWFVAKTGKPKLRGQWTLKWPFLGAKIDESIRS